MKEISGPLGCGFILLNVCCIKETRKPGSFGWFSGSVHSEPGEMLCRQWIPGLMDQWIPGSMDPRINGSLDHQIDGSPDPWITGSMDPRIDGSDSPAFLLIQVRFHSYYFLLRGLTKASPLKQEVTDGQSQVSR